MMVAQREDERKYLDNLNEVKFKQFLKSISRRAIGNSTLRNLGEEGIRERVRNWLEKCMTYNCLVILKGNDYRDWLDRKTLCLNEYLHDFLKVENGWGAARKVLNIFVRDCYYNDIINKNWGLRGFEKYFEVPLDNMTMYGIRHAIKFIDEKESCNIRMFKESDCVSRLSEDLSDTYQKAAQKLIEYRNKKCKDGDMLLRVDLDMYYYRFI